MLTITPETAAAALKALRKARANGDTSVSVHQATLELAAVLEPSADDL